MESLDIWLDDLRDPKDPEIQKRYGAKPWMTWVKTAQEAIDLLATGKVRSISFDHDLGSGGDGYEVAKFLEERAFQGTLPSVQWAVHSDNPEGARYIRLAMGNARRYWDSKGL